MNKAIKLVLFVSAGATVIFTISDLVKIDNTIKGWWLWIITVLVVAIITGYDLFMDVKKSIVVEDGKIKILKKHKLVQEIDISGRPRITIGMKAARIINNGEEFHLGYSEFDRKSVKMLKSL